MDPSLLNLVAMVKLRPHFEEVITGNRLFQKGIRTDSTLLINDLSDQSYGPYMSSHRLQLIFRTCILLIME